MFENSKSNSSKTIHCSDQNSWKSYQRALFAKFKYVLDEFSSLCHLDSSNKFLWKQFLWEFPMRNQVFGINSLSRFSESTFRILEILENVSVRTKSTTFATFTLLHSLKKLEAAESVGGEGEEPTVVAPLPPPSLLFPLPPPFFYPLALHSIAFKAKQLVMQNCYQKGLSFMRFIQKLWFFPLTTI